MVNQKKLDEVLTLCGLRDNLSGTEMVRIAVEHYRPCMSITKELYPAIAQAVNSTPCRVERSMRHAIESGFDRCGWDKDVQTMFGNTIDPDKGRPCNSEFIARLARICRDGLGV